MRIASQLALAAITGLLLAGPAAAVPVCPPFPCTIDFETDDDGNTLVNGQSISTFADVQAGDTVFEFGTIVNISTRQLGTDGHEGAAIFDSDTGGPNDPSGDLDLLVDLGNILILQADESPATTLDPTYGIVFDSPNDEASFEDRGSIVFDFLFEVEMISLDLIDINGGAQSFVVLIDNDGDKRTYDVPPMWTNDVTVSPVGWDTLMLNTLSPQLGEGGATATASEDLNFDPTRVVTMNVLFVGNPSSAGLDNITFIPEPSTALLLGLGLTVMTGVVRRIRR